MKEPTRPPLAEAYQHGAGVLESDRQSTRQIPPNSYIMGLPVIRHSVHTLYLPPELAADVESACTGRRD